MQILTPRGLRHPEDMDAGDEVLSRDLATGRSICNRLETRPQWVDRREFARWWSWKPPAFRFRKINNRYVMSRSQSIWANGHTTHVAHLKIGDVLYTERGGLVRIWDIRDVWQPGWWRFDIDGDHTYILDGALVHNANRHWVGGTGDWTPANTTNWSGSAGGAGGSSVPGAADNVTFSSSSGGGTCTLNFGGTITIQFITHNTYTGTFDNSVNNNNMTFSSGGQAWNNTGAGVRTIKLGTATYTFTDVAAIVDWSGSNITNTGNTGANWVFSGQSGARQFLPGTGLAHGNVSFASSTGAGYCVLDDGASSSSINSLSVAEPNYLRVNASNSLGITTAVALAGTSSNQITIASGTHATQATLALAGGSTFDWCSFRDMNFTGSPTASNSFNSLNNSGITITAPSGGATASARVIGG